MLARDVMTHQPKTVTPDESIATAAAIMNDEHVGIVPVVADAGSMQLIGAITDRDIAVRCAAMGHDTGLCLVREHMTPVPLTTVHSGADVDEVIGLMARSHVQRVLVVSGKDRLIGIVSLTDLAAKLGPWDPARIGHVIEQISQTLVTPS